MSVRFHGRAGWPSAFLAFVQLPKDTGEVRVRRQRDGWECSEHGRHAAALCPHEGAALAAWRRATKRPDRATVEALLAADGQDATLTRHEMLEDVDGIPNSILTTTTTGTLSVHLDHLGWTEAEWSDPTITE